MKNHLSIAKLSAVVISVFALLVSGTVCAQVWEDSVELYSGDTASYQSTNHPLKRIVIGDPDKVHVDVISKDTIVLVGRAMGQSKIFLKDNNDNVTTLNVFVSPDVSLLKHRFHQLFPNQDIEIYSNTNGVILSGFVTGAEVVEQVLRVAQQVLAEPVGAGPKPITVDKKVKSTASKEELATVIAQKQIIPSKSGEAGEGGSGMGKSSPAIINMMKIKGPQQVMLEVKFAEVTRLSGRELEAGFSLGKLGNDFSAATSTSVDGITAVPALSSLLVNFADGLASNVFVSIDNFKLALKFLEEESLARVLAEPRLVTQSGQEASFLAGGEYPYQVVDNDEVEIEFKEFGVGLKFTPIVNSDGLITMRVAPSVTDISGFVNDNEATPILSTRKLESTVHMRDGQTLALAGLLKENMTDSINKIPLLGDLPVLGALFRSSDYKQNKTDLLVAITPHIVQPLHETEISFPGEFIKPPNRYEFYLEGRLEGRRTPEDPSQMLQHSFASPVVIDGGGLEGSFGHVETVQ